MKIIDMKKKLLYIILLNATPFFLEWLQAAPVAAFFMGERKMQNKKAVTVYIDGFNFYYGIAKNSVSRASMFLYLLLLLQYLQSQVRKTHNL